jgi:hypothetical protein
VRLLLHRVRDPDERGNQSEAVDALAKAIGDVDAARTAGKTGAEAATTTGEAERLAAQKARLDAEIAEIERA